MKILKTIWSWMSAHPILAVIVIGVLARIAVLVFFRGGVLLEAGIIPPPADQGEYLGLADSIYGGRGFCFDRGFTEKGRPYVYRPPFYPLLLGLMKNAAGGHLGAVRAMQVLLTLIFIPLAAFIISFITSDRSVRLLTTMIIGLNPYLIYFSTRLLSDWLFFILFSCGICFFIAALYFDGKWRYLLTGAITFALASLTRGEGWYFFWLMIVCYFLARPGRVQWKKLAVSVATYGVVMSPWIVRNYIHFNKFIPAQQGTIGRTMIASYAPSWTGVEWAGYEDWMKSVFEKEKVLPEENREAFLLKEAKTFFFTHFDTLIMTSYVKLRQLWAFFPSKSFHGNPFKKTPYQSRIYDVLSWVSFVIFIPFFLFGMIMLARERWKLVFMLLAILSANAAIGVIGNLGIRIRLQIHFLFLLMACVGLDYVARYLKRRQIFGQME